MVECVIFHVLVQAVKVVNIATAVSMMSLVGWNCRYFPGHGVRNTSRDLFLEVLASERVTLGTT